MPGGWRRSLNLVSNVGGGRRGTAMTPETASSSSGGSSDEAPRLRPGGEERLMVAVRIKPMEADGAVVAPRILYAADKQTVVLEEADRRDVFRQKIKGQEKQYRFDVVFPGNASQEEVYETTTSDLVKDVLNGYNGAVFAYGATGSGKTHTMVGDGCQPGIMVRALNDMFEAIRERDNECSVSMSYLELYNEQIRDLLNPSSGYLELREDVRGSRSVQVAGLRELFTTSTEDVLELLQQGNRARTVEPTAMNATSSRSHALLSVNVRQTSPVSKPDHLRMRVKHGRLFMVDLAGSERANKTRNRGKRLQEGAHINRSLLALGNCINALSGGARFVNYRDSKLTRLLKDALSGNCRTVMIAHVASTLAQRDETRNTLTYAERAACINTKVQHNVFDVSYHVTQYQAVISELRDEVSRLQTKMKEERPRSGDIRLRAEGMERTNEVKRLREEIVDTFKSQMKLRRKLMEIDSHLLGLGMEAERQHMIISHWESRNNKLYKQQAAATAAAVAAAAANSGSASGEAAVQQAWAELNDIERDQERWAELRTHIEQKLEACRQRGVGLEDKLPSLLSSDDEREILALMCRVHELEADKMALQSERLVRQHELRRRDLLILRYDRQRQLCEEIITKQRQLIEAGRIQLPPDLQELYQYYQQEIHAATYPELTPQTMDGCSMSSDYLPPISSRGEFFPRTGTNSGGTTSGSGGSAPSSADSDDLDIPQLPPLRDSSIVDRIMGAFVSRPGYSLVPPSSRVRRSVSDGRLSRVADSTANANR